MKRVLVTGATGFVGRGSLSPLVARGYDVHAVTSRVRDDATTGVTWHRADLLRPSDVEAVVSRVRPSHLLHFAWYAEHRLFWNSPLNLRWVQATLELVQAFSAQGGRRALLTGTCFEYGPCEGVCDELTTAMVPNNLYATCKHATHLVVAAFARETGISLAWGRIFFPFGPHEPPNRLVPSVVRALLKGEPARCSHGNQVRDFLHVDDAASASVALLDSDVVGAVNIGSGVPIRVRDVAETIARQLHRPDLIQLGAIESPPDEPAVLVAATSRLRSEVGWQPADSLDSGLARSIDWWRAVVE